MNDVFQVGLATLTSLAVGVGVGWFLAQVVGQRIAHKYRLIEERSRVFMRYNETHYMPYLAWGRSLVARLSENPVDEESSFFDLGQFLAIEYRWGKEVGGYLFLEDLVAEELFVSLDHEVCKTLGSIFGRKILDKIVVELECEGHFSQWAAKLQPGGSMNDAFATFQQWCRNGDRNMFLLRLECALDLFGFEINWFTRKVYKQDPAKPPVLKKRGAQDLVINALKRLEDKGEIQPNEREGYMRKIGLPLC